MEEKKNDSRDAWRAFLTGYLTGSISRVPGTWLIVPDDYSHFQFAVGTPDGGSFRITVDPINDEEERRDE